VTRNTKSATADKPELADAAEKLSLAQAIQIFSNISTALGTFAIR